MSYPYGTVLRPAIERFMEKVEVREDGCWQWLGGEAGQGYGGFFKGRASAEEHGRIAAHRWSYEHHVGPIPEGLVLDHLCRNRRCVNPVHLEPVPQAENVRRGTGNGTQTHCPKRHPYSGDNLYVTPRGERQCRQCKRDALARYRARKTGK